MAEWADKGPQKDLRAVFSIHSENVDLIVAEDANINSIQHLRGKRVNIGRISSGYRQNAIDALEANGLKYEQDFYVKTLNVEEVPRMIQDGRLDAGFYTVGHPSGYYMESTAGTRKVKFIQIPNVDKIVKKYSYYDKSVTPIKDYPREANKENIPTFGVKATFVTSAKVPDEVVMLSLRRFIVT